MDQLNFCNKIRSVNIMKLFLQTTHLEDCVQQPPKLSKKLTDYLPEGNHKWVARMLSSATFRQKYSDLRGKIETSWRARSLLVTKRTGPAPSCREELPGGVQSRRLFCWKVPSTPCASRPLRLVSSPNTDNPSKTRFSMNVSPSVASVPLFKVRACLRPQKLSEIMPLRAALAESLTSLVISHTFSESYFFTWKTMIIDTYLQRNGDSLLNNTAW